MSLHRQDRAVRSRLRILEAATALFAERGFDATSIRDVAHAADASVGLVCRYFPTREHFAFAIYDRLADELAHTALELPAGTIAERFTRLMQARITQCEQHRRALTSLLGRALDPESVLYALGPHTERTRATVHGTLAVLVSGSTNAPASMADASRLAQVLYTAQLGVVLATLARPEADWALALVEQLGRALKWARPSLLVIKRLLGDGWERLLLDRPRTTADHSVRTTSRELLTRLFRDNRVLPGVPQGLTSVAEALHLPRVEAFVRAGAPLELVLPAFPAKAPNPRKVLGTLPDLAEVRALERLSELLDSLEAVWAPGARLTICSDGHVFADAVGVADAEVDAYRDALVASLDDERIGWFDLGTAFDTRRPTDQRRALMDRYAGTDASLRERARTTPSLAAQVDGIHRFLFEDEVVLHPGLTRNQARKQTRDRAYEVVRRSEAWGALVAAAFPEALRLSIHPQPEASLKIGLNLLGVEDPWLTPWHAVAVVDRTHTSLMHRADAEALGARVVFDGGRPSHLELP